VEQADVFLPISYPINNFKALKMSQIKMNSTYTANKKTIMKWAAKRHIINSNKFFSCGYNMIHLLQAFNSDGWTRQK